MLYDGSMGRQALSLFHQSLEILHLPIPHDARESSGAIALFYSSVPLGSEMDCLCAELVRDLVRNAIDFPVALAVGFVKQLSLRFRGAVEPVNAETKQAYWQMARREPVVEQLQTSLQQFLR